MRTARLSLPGMCEKLDLTRLHQYLSTQRPAARIHRCMWLARYPFLQSEGLWGRQL